MKMKAEIRVMLLQAKQLQRWAGDQQKLGDRKGRNSSSQPSEGTNSAITLFTTFQSPDVRQCLLFKQPSLYFVWTSLAN